VPADDRVQRLADLAVEFGANLQPGQILGVTAEPGHAEFVRAVAASAYRRGARFVDAWYFDPWVKRARLLHGRDETLEFVPEWYGQRVLGLGDERGARLTVAGSTEPEALAGVDAGRAGRDRLPNVKEASSVLAERTTNWTIVPFPTPGWAGRVHPDLDADEALERLWEEIIHVCRLDERDPVAAWRTRMDELARVAEQLTDHRFDALHLEGPGTDLTVGLLRTARWLSAEFTTADGLAHFPNLPTEEVFTTPDPRRADGVVRSTKPLVLEGGLLIRGLEIRFEGGRAVEVDAEEGADTMRARVALDDEAGRLGEVALVDREGRVGRVGTVFYNTLLDENAASHLALGRGFPFLVDGEDDRERVNATPSGSHIDFMVGGDEVDATGITAGGERVPVLRGGTWQL
jgi:aminopeptidase